MKEIFYDEIIKYKTPRKNKWDYTHGGIYLITDVDMNNLYVGKSIDYMLRLKNHIINSRTGNGIAIDRFISNYKNVRYFLVESYIDLGINFFNRKLEIINENKYILKFNTYYPFGYNFTYYGKL